MGIKHTVPAGLPTGTVTGKVAGDDWRADHLHIPFEVSLWTAGAAALAAPWAATQAVNTETASKAMRNRIDLSQASQFRLTALQGTASTPTNAALKMVYTTTQTAILATSTPNLAASGETLVIGTTGNNGLLIDTGWVNIATDAKVDNVYVTLFQVVTLTVAGTWGNIKVFFK